MPDVNVLPPLERDPRQPSDFDPVSLGRQILRSTRTGTLGTLDRTTGFPFTSLVSLATDLDGAPVILISGLSHHTKNLKADARCSVLLSQGGKGDPMAHPRLTLTARAEICPDDVIRRRFLARHPKSALYVDFPDFSFFRLSPLTMHLNGGFARAFDGDAGYILSDIMDRAAFAAMEHSAIQHLNEEHPDTVALYAEALCAMPAGKWRATGLDPDGLDLALGERVARVAFHEPILTRERVDTLLKSLAHDARVQRSTQS